MLKIRVVVAAKLQRQTSTPTFKSPVRLKALPLEVHLIVLGADKHNQRLLLLKLSGWDQKYKTKHLLDKLETMKIKKNLKVQKLVFSL